jgi:hypothetical protein
VLVEKKKIYCLFRPLKNGLLQIGITKRCKKILIKTIEDAINMM